MRLRFVVVEGAANPHGDLAIVALQGTKSFAGGAGSFVAELLGLLLGRGFERPGQQRLHGSHRDIFHLGQIDIQAGALLAPLLSDDDFSPSLGEFVDVAEVFDHELACGHVASLQEDAAISADEIVS